MQLNVQHVFNYSLASHPEHVILPNPNSISDANEIRNEESLEFELEEEVRSVMTEHIEEEKQEREQREALVMNTG